MSKLLRPPDMSGATGASGRGPFGGSVARLDVDRVSRARNILLFVAVLATISTIISYVAVPDTRPHAATEVLAMNGSLAVVYFGIWIWSRRTVLVPSMVALCIYIGVILLHAAVEPASLTQGFVLRGLIILALIGAIREARIAQSFPWKKRGLVVVSVMALIALAVVLERIYTNAYKAELLPVPEFDIDSLPPPPAVRAPPRGAEINLDKLPPRPALQAP